MKNKEHLRELNNANYKKKREQRAAVAKAWRSANPDKVRRTIIKQKYGLTQEMHDQMLSDQENRCPITLEEFTSTPHIDHCHTTGKVRGLLSQRANQALGLLRDNPDELRRAIEYLEKYVLKDPVKSISIEVPKL